jgi:UDP:flavonoid glycosyltransferase YjiC (YdhE family)
MQHQDPVSLLIAPLDWGLGHATRCIPIIKELVRQGARISIAASGPQKSLLEIEFPGLEFFDLPGYGIRYQRGIFLKWGLLFRTPAILKRIKRENQWLAGILKTQTIDAVISDNRYGIYNPDLYCVFLTHQLSVRSGLGSLFDRLLLIRNYAYIRKFSACWVPDWPGGISLAGRLSHPPVKPPIPTLYTGILSRIKPIHAELKKNSLLILLSGPEPQRSDFEKIILSQLGNLTMKCTVVRGLPGSGQPIPSHREGMEIVNHLPSEELNALMCKSEIVITRSGYSTIMDLVQLRKNAILVPTPGQTEQEYLGCHLHKMKWMLTVPQKNFNLKKAIAAFQQSAWIQPDSPESALGTAVADLLNNSTGFNIKHSAF